MNEYIYGRHTVATLLARQPGFIKRLILASSEEAGFKCLLADAAAAKVPVLRCSRAEIAALLPEGAVHQGVVAECHPLPTYHESDIPGLLGQYDTPQTILILDGVQDPHNLGACLRSAAAFGVLAVIAPKDKAATLTPIVKKVSCGAVYAVPFIPVTNLARTMRDLQDRGIWLVGAAGEAKEPLAEIDLTGHIAMVMGSEGKGLRQLTRKHCDYLAKIPIDSSVESLNVSVATGIALYEVRRQRHLRSA